MEGCSNGTREEKKEDGPTPGLLATLTYSGERHPEADPADHLEKTDVEIT